MARETPGLHAENIKAELRKKFGSLAGFAAKYGTTPQSVSGAIHSPTRSSRVELMIAEALGVSPHQLWPDRWTPIGQKIDRAVFRRVSA